MTQDEFRKGGWLKYFTQFSEEELATIVLCGRCLVEMGLWTDLVRYCNFKIEEYGDQRFDDEDEEPEVLH